MKKIINISMLMFLITVLVACGEDNAADGSNEGVAGQEEETSYPTEQLNYTVAFGPGGGNDLMSRTLVDVLNKYDLFGGQNIVVENRDGGSGAIGFSYVKAQEGDPYHVTSTSGNFISTALISDTDWSYEDFTPIGLLATDAMVLVVTSNSGIESINDFVELANSQRVTVGGTGAAGPSRVVASLFAESAEIDFEYVPSQDGGQMVTSLTSGSVDAIVANPSEVAGQLAAGNVIALAYSDEERSEIYPDVPTFTEEGYEFSFSLPRGVVLPGGIPEDVQEWWIETLQEVVEKPEWQAYLEQNSLAGNNLWGDEFGEYLETTSNDFERILREIDAIE